MRTSLRFHAAFSLATVALLALSGLKAAAADPKALPTQSATESVTAENIKKLQEAIGGLERRLISQADILEKNSTELGILRNQVENSLRPGMLKSMQDSVATLTNRIAETKASLGVLNESQEKQFAGTTAQLRELSGLLARLPEQLAQNSQASADSIEKLSKVIAASRAAAASVPPPIAPDPVPKLLGAFLLGILLIGGLVIFSLRRQLRALQTTDRRMTAALTQERESLRQELLNRPAVAPAGGEDFSSLRAQLHDLLARQGPTATLQSDYQTAKMIPRPPVPNDEQTTLNLSTVTAGIPAAVCWTAAFFDPASPMTAWRAQIESHLTSPEHPSLPVLSSWLTLRAVCSRQPAPALAEVADAVAALSRALHEYWETMPELGEDEFARASGDWIAAVKSLISSVAPKLEIREVLPGGRFDSDTMQTMREGSGNHLNVAAVFSWIILERTGERARVLHRGRIATT